MSRWPSWILPTVTTPPIDDFPSAPQQHRGGSYAPGCTCWETTCHVLLLAAMPAIVTGVVISAGRVFGEAAALIFTSGSAAANISFASTSLSGPA
ncbi:ABC transporter permease subunit [Olsenella sp. Marseille-P4559]|uniref:ABC transporter permease subunit n=1 Tax=Olsenella sp. Marseille-P4559 TaxID=2364795 RepID=UPI00352DBF8E